MTERNSNNQNLADFKVGVDNAIFSIDTQQNRLLILLVMRHDEPYLGYWCLPGTLVRNGETLETAADRILSEKIKVDNLYLEQLYTFGGPGRDPREAADSYDIRYLSVSYFALVRYEAAELIATGVGGNCLVSDRQITRSRLRSSTDYRIRTSTTEKQIRI